jgi:thiol-disulfide isomerase/thioredoxin
MCVGLAMILAGARAPAVAATPELKRWAGVNPPPPIELNTLDGQPFRLEQLRGRLVLLNFWATWCDPCVEEMPSMQRLMQHFAGAPFDVVAVNHMEGVPRIRAFLQKVPVDFTIVRDTDGGIARRWRVGVFPSSYVIDAQGHIRYALVGAVDWTAPSIIGQLQPLLPRAGGTARSE